MSDVLSHLLADQKLPRLWAHEMTVNLRELPNGGIGFFAPTDRQCGCGEHVVFHAEVEKISQR
ncbi:hypothetical protein D3C79_699110 [compost metagenome]